jgi:hypothetical protein
MCDQKEQRPHYCPEKVKLFDKTFTFEKATDFIVPKKSSTISVHPDPPPMRKLVVYEIRNCTTYIRIENQTSILATRGPWIATLQDDYTRISGPSAETIEHAVELLSLEISLVNDLLESIKCGKQS